jgi:TRAP-type mannitol/chloroaromatic compound transport system permease large subunit
MPLFVPAAQALGIDMVWFGVMMAVNLQMAFISPPVGFSLFYSAKRRAREMSPPPTFTTQRVAVYGLQDGCADPGGAFPQTVRWLIDLAAQ